MNKIIRATVAVFSACVSFAADITIVENGRSALKIYHPVDAPASVRIAAKELATYFRKATGVALPVVTTPEKANCIMLGDAALAEDAGASMKDIAAEGFRIAVKNGNVHITGIDTKEGAIATEAGFSMGTLFGTYTFIERFLGVRWFMPTEVGEYVPKTAVVKVPHALDVRENPLFRWRRIPYLAKKSNGPAITEWCPRNRLNDVS